MADRPICDAFVAVAELCQALGEHPLTRYPGCWECKVDEHWSLAVNGHKEAKVCTLTPTPIEPFHCYVEFNGWPAFIINPYGGFGAAGAAANEDTFIAAVRARIAAVQARPEPARAWPFPTGDAHGG